MRKLAHTAQYFTSIVAGLVKPLHSMNEVVAYDRIKSIDMRQQVEWATKPDVMQ